MTPAEKFFLECGSKIPEAEKSQLFGKPCFKLKGKAFTCLFNEQMVFKLTGDAHRSALSLDGAALFDPSGKGRPMKEWVQLPLDYQDQWELYTNSAFDFVNSLSK